MEEVGAALAAFMRQLTSQFAPDGVSAVTYRAEQGHRA